MRRVLIVCGLLGLAACAAPEAPEPVLVEPEPIAVGVDQILACEPGGDGIGGTGCAADGS